MKKYDVIVVGAGDVGLAIAFSAASENLKVALIDKGHVGGTCVNYGCVPSKTLIYTADRITEIRDVAKFGVAAEVRDIDFPAIMSRTREVVMNGRKGIGDAIKDTENLDFFQGEAHFTGGRTLQVGNETVSGKKIFIATGTRPAVPLIKGLDTVPYLTNENVLNLEKRPESMVIIGGSFVGLEYAHFFSAVGTKVTVLKRSPSLLPFAEPEIAELLKKEIATRIELLIGLDPVEVGPTERGCVVKVRDVALGADKEVPAGAKKEVYAETLLVAAGRESNADILKVERAGIETDRKNFIKVDDYLRTNKRHIWALGDAIGRAMFTHAGDKEAELAWHNATHRKKLKMDFGSVPYAVFTHPQIAGIGLTEKQAAKNHEIVVGRAMYSDTVMGEAMLQSQGFAKAVVEKESGRILGFHIIGPHAAMLIQEVVNAVINRLPLKSITGSMHIFPALSNLIPEALDQLK